MDGRYDEIKTMADGAWGITSELYRMNGNRRISDAVIIVVDMPEDKDFQEMRELARYFFEDMEQIVQKKQSILLQEDLNFHRETLSFVLLHSSLFT